MSYVIFTEIIDRTKGEPFFEMNISHDVSGGID